MKVPRAIEETPANLSSVLCGVAAQIPEIVGAFKRDMSFADVLGLICKGVAATPCRQDE